MERRVVQLSAAHLPNPGQHLFLAVREPRLQPVLEVVGDSPREAEQQEERSSGARLRRGLQDRRSLVVGEPRDHGGHVHPHRNARLGQLADRRQPPGGRRRPGLHGPLHVVAERGHRDGDVHALPGGQLREHVQVARRQVVLGHDAHRVPEVQEDLKAAAGQPKPPLRGLIGIRDAGHAHHLGLPGRCRQRFPQQLRRVPLDQDLPLEVQPRGEPQLLVRGTGVAVDAPVLAAPIRVDRGLEGHVGTPVAGHDRPRGVFQELRAELAGVSLLRVHLDVHGFVAVRRVVRYGPTAERQEAHPSIFGLSSVFGKRRPPEATTQ